MASSHCLRVHHCIINAQVEKRVRIASDADVAAGLAALLDIDPRLRPAANFAGQLPLRRRAGGFEGLAAIVTAQQISDAAAASIWARLRTAVEPFTAERFLEASEATLRTAGLSRAKIRTLNAVATASLAEFDLDRLHEAPADEALAAMLAIRGIGPWTAEVYLLFCAGHPDIFPAGDLALQVGAQHALGLDDRPSERALRAIASAWTPWRGVAARLLWTYYRLRRDAARRSADASGGGG